jgi:hypothetical protein
VINPHAEPTLIGPDIVNTVRDGLAQLLVLEIVATHLFRLPLWLPFPPAVLEVPQQPFLLGINRNDRLVSVLELSALPVQVFKLSVAVLVR